MRVRESLELIDLLILLMGLVSLWGLFVEWLPPVEDDESEAFDDEG